MPFHPASSRSTISIVSTLVWSVGLCGALLAGVGCGDSGDQSQDDNTPILVVTDAGDNSQARDVTGEGADVEADSADTRETDAPMCPEAADCSAAECGPDPVCGTSCGSCQEGTCQEGECVPNQCQPDCEGRECGSDGCGGTCGDGCASDQQCDEGSCVPCEKPLGDELSSTGTTTLTDDCVYQVESNVKVDERAWLTAEPGARIEFAGPHVIAIEGTMKLRGSQEAPVVVSGDGDSSPAENWGNIYLAGDQASFETEHAILEHFGGFVAGRTGDFEVTKSTVRNVELSGFDYLDGSVQEGAFDISDGVTGTVKQTTFENIRGDGDDDQQKGEANAIYKFTPHEGGVTVTDSTFTDIAGSAMYFNGFNAKSPSNVIVEHNAIRDNDGWGIVTSNVASDIGIRKNDVRNNARGGISVGLTISGLEAEYTVSNNNLVGNGPHDLGVYRYENFYTVDATSVYWGDGVTPDDRVDAPTDLPVDTSNKRSDPVPDAGPR